MCERRRELAHGRTTIQVRHGRQMPTRVNFCQSASTSLEHQACDQHRLEYQHAGRDNDGGSIAFPQRELTKADDAASRQRGFCDTPAAQLTPVERRGDRRLLDRNVLRSRTMENAKGDLANPFSDRLRREYRAADHTAADIRLR